MTLQYRADRATDFGLRAHTPVFFLLVVLIYNIKSEYEQEYGTINLFPVICFHGEIPRDKPLDQVC